MANCIGIEIARIVIIGINYYFGISLSQNRMYETVNVYDAIKKGQQRVNYPVFFIMISIWSLSIYLNSVYNLSRFIIGLSILGSVIIAWLYWSFAITKWRIWAFENVRNVHELKKKAIQSGLIWKDGSFFEKTEIRTSAERGKLKSLEYKFDQPDIFNDDILIEKETIVLYSKNKIYFEAVINLCICLGGVYFVAMRQIYLSVFMILAGGYLAYKSYKKIIDTEPQIIISDDGIQTVNTPFYTWADIENEDVILEGEGGDSKEYLVYDYPSGGGSEKLPIADFNVSKKQLENLLYVYRLRSGKKLVR